MIIDTHCHLNSEELYSKRAECINKALLLGVNKMIVVGYDVASSKLAIEIAKEYSGIIYAAVGIHPSETIKVESDALQIIEQLAQEPQVVAIGEIGLDYYWKEAPKDLQKQYFAEQIKLAYKYKLPFIVHMREATEDTLELLNENHQFIRKGIMHCYSGSKESVNDFVKLGLYISFGGPLTFKNARVPKEAIKCVPASRLLIETDCPYLTPHPFRGKENEPANVTLVAKEAATILDISYEELCQTTYDNSLRIFDLCKK